jgi:predicted CXXCH cytochrome family protein
VDQPVPLYKLVPPFGAPDLPPGGGGTRKTAPYALETPDVTLAAAGSPHVISGLASDACAACHAAHDAQGPMLLQQSGPQSSTCFTCHDGTGASSDVQSQWSSSSLPANDPATSSYYSHPATSPSSHSSALDDEFGGTLNRHAACADCHQPHLADGTRPVNSVAGWSASGAIGGASGVSVVNGAAGTAPAYTLQSRSEFEYQLCFKCHSGFTQLLPQDPAHPSRWSLDKGVELNPANVSYHPVEAAGKNQTNAMALSLAGTSPYKLWVFGTQDTVRCESCHGNSSATTRTPRPLADASLDNHASPNRGILIAPYRDRTLKPRGLYQPLDFALCYTCHAEAPMVDDSGDLREDTNFNWHGYHLSSISGNGLGGTDIDVPGAGPGNAICAECHFRIHGSALAVNGQAQATGLVNFAPNVQKLGGVLNFQAATPTALGTCTLVCHGKAHNAYGYD